MHGLRVRKKLWLGGIAALLAVSTPVCWAAPYSDEAPLVLRSIMHDLGEHMQATVDAIAHEDWARIEAVAVRIATHPEPPPEEKAQILTLLGADAAHFRGHDVKAGEAAQAMAEAARNQDGQAVIDAFHGVQTSCHGCHQAFRGRLIDQLYAAPR